MHILLLIITLLLFCFMIFIYLNLFYSFYLKVPMLSSGSGAIENFLQNIDLGKAKNFYELGSGSGKMISKVASRYPDLKCIGVEYNIAAYCSAKFRNLFLKQKIDYKLGDFFKINISDADIIYVYLFPGLMVRLEAKFSQELRKGAIVISNSFPIKTRKSKMIIQEKAGALGTLYVYEY